MPRILLISAALALSACGGGGAGNAPSPSPAPTPAPTPSPLPTPTPTPSPTPAPTPSPSPSGTVCGSAFLGNSTVVFTGVCDGLCTNNDGPKAVDNNADTFGFMSFTGAQGSFTMRATTQPGTVVPAGKQAGALLAHVADTAVSTTVTFNTYLNGTMQETVGSANSTASPSTASTPNFVRFANTKAYDRIDMVVQRSGNVSTRIFEVCSE